MFLLRSVALLVAIIAGLAQGGCIRSGGTSLDIRSPQGTYVVELVGPRTTPEGMLDRHVVRASVVTKGHRIEPFEIYSAGFLDSGFDDEFVWHDWPAENVLVFFARSRETDSSTSALTIENNTGRIVRCLQVSTEHLVLVFDLPAAARIKIPLPTLPGSPVTDIRALEVNADGGITAQIAQRIDRTKQSAAVRYRVVVENDTLNVQADQ